MNRRVQSFYGANPDIDIRAEMTSFLEFDKRSRPMILRRMKKNQYGSLIACPQCRKRGTQDHSKWLICDVCHGMGYLWQEEWVRVFESHSTLRPITEQQIEIGPIHEDVVRLYVKSVSLITEDDCFIEVVLSLNGEVASPLTKLHAYNILDVNTYRLEDGRVEYYRTFSKKMPLDFIGQPIDTRRGYSGRTP